MCQSIPSGHGRVDCTRRLLTEVKLVVYIHERLRKGGTVAHSGSCTGEL